MQISRIRLSDTLIRTDRVPALDAGTARLSLI
jgi:hypothetical protein